MYRINFSLFRITLYGNDRKRFHLFYARRGETSRDLTYSLKACHAIAKCTHRRTCVVSKWVVVWEIVPFHDKTLSKSTLCIPETIPTRTKTKKKMNSKILISGFNSKNKRNHIIKNSKVFFYVQCLVDVVATVISNDVRCLVAFSENRPRKISKDNWFKRPLYG